MKGRKPKPTALKKLQGNAGKRPLNKHEPTPQKLTNIEAPDWLDDYARTMWQTVVPELIANGILSVIDAHNVEAFCMSYARWRQAEAEVERLGLLVFDDNGRPTKNPALTIINEAKKQMMSFGALLGLDPSNRTRLIGSAKTEAVQNPFTDFLT